ncbi:MAG TPA: sigma-70 family RNA polymerase sigma factor [Thermoanaerobaculia bacterium]|nr:sigma-70 family RNA polymerase sigma factor [Thermoanaerobaculia bacterium]
MADHSAKPLGRTEQARRSAAPEVDGTREHERDLERELLRRMAQGDEEAVGVLFDRYAGLLQALAFRIVGSPAEAEEVVQDVFLHAWDRAGTYDPSRSSVSTWLVMIARSRAIDRLRTRRVVDRTAEAAAREAPPHESAEGAARVQEDDRAFRVRSELAQLPGEQRHVLELAYYRGLTQTEIAEREGLPLGTVKTRTLLAMKKLRAALRDELRELL